VEQTADWLGSLQLVVDPCCFLGLDDVEGNASGSHHFEGLWTDLEALLDALGQDDGHRPVGEEFLHVGRLNPGDVASPGFGPIPFARSSGEQLRVLERTPVVDF